MTTQNEQLIKELTDAGVIVSFRAKLASLETNGSLCGENSGSGAFIGFPGECEPKPLPDILLKEFEKARSAGTGL